MGIQIVSHVGNESVEGQRTPSWHLDAKFRDLCQYSSNNVTSKLVIGLYPCYVIDLSMPPSLQGGGRKKSMSGGQTRAYPHIIYKWTSNWLHVYKQQMPDKTDTEHGIRNTEWQCADLILARLWTAFARQWQEYKLVRTFILASTSRQLETNKIAKYKWYDLHQWYVLKELCCQWHNIFA